MDDNPRSTQQVASRKAITKAFTAYRKFKRVLVRLVSIRTASNLSFMMSTLSCTMASRLSHRSTRQIMPKLPALSAKAFLSQILCCQQTCAVCGMHVDCHLAGATVLILLCVPPSGEQPGDRGIIRLKTHAHMIKLPSCINFVDPVVVDPDVVEENACYGRFLQRRRDPGGSEDFAAADLSATGGILQDDLHHSHVRYIRCVSAGGVAI